jgi:hypothetical protein
MKTIYCTGFYNRSEVNCDWYSYKQSREDGKLSTGASLEVYFEFNVGDETKDDDISFLADDYAYFELKKTLLACN